MLFRSSYSSLETSPLASPTWSPIRQTRPESLDLNKLLADSLDLENFYRTNDNKREVSPPFQARNNKNLKGKQVKGISNPRYKRKRNFSKFERGESSKSIR